MISGTYSVLTNTVLMPSTYLLWLEAPEIASSTRPGQFAMLRCGNDLQRMLRRPLTVHQVEGSRIAFLYRVAGAGTQWLSQRQAGDVADLLGPLGNGFSVNRSSHRLLLTAGGLGIAPLRFLADSALAQGHEVTLLVGAKTASALYPGELLPPEIRLISATEDGSVGEKGLVTELLPRYAAGADQVFACGPEGMYRAMASDRRVLPANCKVQVSLEVRMGCGVGACLSCTVKTRGGLKHVCKDGPVFDLDDVLWWEAPSCML
ncbi:MAG TPA: dihydroorotate dehydrogenase electron transfer subunit [Dehalococcoidia bacterium]|nr:dihydroorotate dehydrogenase electron transfer subunit [Dehalococcoidia bacterium]